LFSWHKENYLNHPELLVFMVWNLFNEIGRKIIHITILIVLLVFFILKNSKGQQTALLFLVGLLLFFLILEYLRLELNFKLPFFHQFIRQKEQFRIYGVVFFLSSTIIALAVFDTAIALAALLMTTFGDMAAAIFGKKYGTTILYNNKTIIGFIAGLIANIVVATVVSPFFAVNIYVLIFMAFAATITETLVDELDDNLMIPIVSGFIGQILLLLL
jgi:phytol kinase